MAQGRCPGECGYENTVAKVESHMRKCKDYARVFMTSDDVSSPAEAYAAAHPPRAPVERKPRTPKEQSDPPGASDSPPAEDQAPRSGDSGEPEGAVSEGSARTSPGRKRRSRPAPAPLVPAADAKPAVEVEYWDRVPDLLESMRADAAAGAS